MDPLTDTPIGGSPWRQAWRSLAGPFDLAAVVSLVVLVPSPARVGSVPGIAAALIAALVIVFPRVRRAPWPWAVFTLLHVVIYVGGWYRLDNHDALAAYWAAALLVASLASAPDRLLGLQARLLVGITFTLATAWKLFSGQFLDGEFFRFTILTDPRFALVAERAGGIPPEAVVENGNRLFTAATALEPVAVPLVGVDRIGWVVVVLTIGTILVEAMVAVTMLAPDRLALARLRTPVLAFFLVATYAIVPVSRFGVLLVSLAIAQETRHQRARVGFAVGAMLLVAWSEAWMRLVGIR